MKFAHMAAILSSSGLICWNVGAQSSTVFTYQGSLNEGGERANGLFDISFSLWDAVSDGNQIGGTISLVDVPVDGGLFIVELDFGANALDNNARWLEIMVGRTTLAPRQPITRAPYSIQTRGIFVGENERVGIGTTSPQMQFDVHEPTIMQGNIPRMGVTGTAGGNGHWLTASLTPSPTVAWNDDDTLRFGTEDALGMGFDEMFSASTSGAREFLLSADIRMPIRRIHLGDVPGTGGARINIRAPFTGLSVETLPTGGGQTYSIICENEHDVGVGVRAEVSSTTGNLIGVWGINNSPNGFSFFATSAGGDYGSASSGRWKRNVRNIDGPLEKTAQIRGVFFDWDEEHGGRHAVGFIAEEVGEVLPEVVIYEENGIDAIGMDYSKMTPLLVEAVNALRAEKDSQLAQRDAEIAALQSEVTELRAIVMQLLATEKGQKP